MIIWLVLALGGLVLAGVGAFFVRIGVGDANQWAGVLGFFVGAAGLGVSGYGVWLARRTATTPASPQPPVVPPGQALSGSVGGDNIQIGSARDVTIDRDRPAP